MAHPETVTVDDAMPYTTSGNWPSFRTSLRGVVGHTVESRGKDIYLQLIDGVSCDGLDKVTEPTKQRYIVMQLCYDGNSLRLLKRTLQSSLTGLHRKKEGEGFC